MSDKEIVDYIEKFGINHAARLYDRVWNQASLAGYERPTVREAFSLAVEHGWIKKGGAA